MFTIVAAAAAAAATPGITVTGTVHQVRTADVDAQFSRSVDARGRTHLSGVDQASGKRFHFIVSPSGTVRATVERQEFTFRAPAK